MIAAIQSTASTTMEKGIIESRADMFGDRPSSGLKQIASRHRPVLGSPRRVPARSSAASHGHRLSWVVPAVSAAMEAAGRWRPGALRRDSVQWRIHCGRPDHQGIASRIECRGGIVATRMAALNRLEGGMNRDGAGSSTQIRPAPFGRGGLRRLRRRAAIAQCPPACQP